MSPAIEAARLLSEFQAGKVVADVGVIEVGYLNVLKSVGALDRYCATNMKNIPSAFVYDKDCYIQPTVRITPHALLYNTKLVDKSEVPADMMAVLNNTNAIPKWAGKFIMPDPSSEAVITQWLVGMRAYFNSNDTWKQFLTNIKNLKPRYVTGFTPAVQAVISGEELMGLAVISYIASMAPAPLNYIPSKLPILAGQIAFGMMKNGPHPNAAKVLAEFLLSDTAAQAIAAAGEISTIPKYAPAGIPGLEKLNIAPLTPLSADDILKWQAYFKQFFETS
jgi:iron(III) transport system substrate-binding protein